MAERTDSKIVARKDDHIEVTALKFNGMLDSLEKFMDRLSKSVARTAEIQGRNLDRDRDSKDRHRRSNRDSRDSRDSRNSRDNRRSYGSDSDSSSEDDRQRSRSRDSSRSRSAVEEGLSRTVFIATNQIMICLIFIDIPKT